MPILMRKYLLIIFLLTPLVAYAGLFDWVSGLFQPAPQTLQLGDVRVFRPSQGGTGTSSTPTDNQILLGDGTQYGVKTLTAGTNITFSETGSSLTINGGAGGSGDPFAWTPLYNGAINATSTTLGFLNGFVSSGASSSISDLVQFTNTGTTTFLGGIYTDALQTNLLNCDTLDTNGLGAIVCGADATGGGAGVPNLIYRALSGTKYYTASTSATDNLSFHFNNGFVSSASSSIAGNLRLDGTLLGAGTFTLTGSGTSTLSDGLSVGGGGLASSKGLTVTGGNLLFTGNRVGIGTAEPAYKLDVAGHIRARSGYYVIGTTIQGGNLSTADSPSFGEGSQGNKGMFFPINDTVAFSTAGVERLRVGTGGNIGIGSTTPGTLLALGDTTTYINLDNTGTSTFSDGLYVAGNSGLRAANAIVDGILRVVGALYAEAGAIISSFLQIPNGDNPTVDSVGEIAVDTTAEEYDQLVVFGDEVNAIVPPSFSFYVASSTPQGNWNTATTTFEIPGKPYGITVSEVGCRAVAGTFVNIYFGDGTNTTTVSRATTTISVYDKSSNNSWNPWERFLITVGSSSGAPNAVDCTILYKPTRQ